MGKLTASQVWSHFEECIARNDQAATVAYLELKALLYLRPEQCPVAERKLAGAALSAAFQGIASALADAGHSQAQGALCAVLRSRLGKRKAAMELAAKIGSLGDAGPDAVKLLQSIVTDEKDEDVASSALLALGRIAGSKARNLSPDADALISWLLDFSRMAKSDDVKRVSYLALGNAGSVRALGALEEGLRQPSPALRAAAAFALRWIEDDTASARLSLILTRDASPEVRKQAAAALGFRSNAQRALLAGLRDSDAGVRFAALESLAKQKPLNHESVEAVLGLSGDPDKDVREAALSLLSEAASR